jgi:hypothetical protein
MQEAVAARGGAGRGNCPRAPAGGAPKEGGKKFFLDDGTSEGGDRGVARGSDFPRPPLGVYTQSKLNTPKQKFSYTYSHTPPIGGCMPLCNRLD